MTATFGDASELVAVNADDAASAQAVGKPFRDGDYVVEWMAVVKPQKIAPGQSAVLQFTAKPDPAVLEKVLEGVAASLVPVVMVAIGLQVKLKLPPGSWGPFGTGLFIKLIIAPLFALGICLLLNQNSLAAKVSMFESGMPPMVTAGALALTAGLAPKISRENFSCIEETAPEKLGNDDFTMDGHLKLYSVEKGDFIGAAT